MQHRRRARAARRAPCAVHRRPGIRRANYIGGTGGGGGGGDGGSSSRNAANPSAFRSARIAALDDRFPSRFLSLFSSYCARERKCVRVQVPDRSKNAAG